MRIFRVTGAVLWLIAAFIFAGAASASAEDYDFRFHAYPSPFVPGYETATFFYAIPADGTASIDVYNFQGKRVRTIIANAGRPLGIYDGDDTWDGRDDDGEVVLPGPYIVVLEVTINGASYRDTFVTVVNR